MTASERARERKRVDTFANPNYALFETDDKQPRLVDVYLHRSMRLLFSCRSRWVSENRRVQEAVDAGIAR